MNKLETYLYRVAVATDEGDFQIIVLSAEDDEQIFRLAEQQLERYTIRTPQVNRWVIEEKKRAHRGNGYVIATSEEEL